MAAVDFEESPEVREVAVKIINQHHPHLQDAADLIGFYFRFGASDWAGKAKKCTAFERHVTGYMLFVFINAQDWGHLNPEKRNALVDHELCHFMRTSHRKYDEELQKWTEEWDRADQPDSWSIRDHDVEEFSQVIQRHGLWDVGIEQFARAVRNAPYQKDLFEDERQIRAI